MPRIFGLVLIVLAGMVGGCGVKSGDTWTAGPTTIVEYSDAQGRHLKLTRVGVWNTKVGSIQAKTSPAGDSLGVEGWTAEEKMSQNVGKALDLATDIAAKAAKP